MKDAVGDVDDNESELRPMELTVRRILNASGLRNAMLNNRIVKAIRTQLAKMKKIASKAMKSGGRTFRNLMERWKSDSENYEFKVYFSEMDLNYYRADNERLRSLKRRYRQKFEDELAKRIQLEEVQRSKKIWRKKNKNIFHKLRKNKQNNKKRNP